MQWVRFNTSTQTGNPMWFENSIPSSEPLQIYHTPQKKIEHVQFATENKISPKFEASFLLGPFYTAIFFRQKTIRMEGRTPCHPSHQGRPRSALIPSSPISLFPRNSVRRARFDFNATAKACRIPCFDAFFSHESKPKTWGFNFKGYEKPYFPDAPCIVYLPTFGS